MLRWLVWLTTLSLLYHRAELPPLPVKHRGVVRFELLADGGHTFEVTGSWNQWQRGQHRMIQIGDYYYVEIALPRGTYEYVFINEKNESFLPPHIEAKVDDGFGGFNGVVYVP